MTSILADLSKRIVAKCEISWNASAETLAAQIHGATIKTFDLDTLVKVNGASA